MKKRISLLLFTALISFSFINVNAKRMLFIVDCEESRKAYQRYTGMELTKTGIYDVNVDNIDEELEGGSSSTACAPSISGEFACSVGCIENNVVDNKVDGIDLFGSNLEGLGENVNGYCKTLCVDNKEFIAPENNLVTVKQGTRFNWLNSEGHVLTLKNERTCLTFFDSSRWQSDYSSAQQEINSSTLELSKTSGYWCRTGYQLSTINGKHECIKLTSDGMFEYDDYGKLTIENPTCNKNFYFSTRYDRCVMDSEYKQNLINRRVAAANKIDSLIEAANDCNGHKSNGIQACNDVKISYSDEVYGPILNEDANYNKLVSSGGSSYAVNSVVSNRVSYNKYSCDNNSCRTSSVVVNILKSKKETIRSEYNWDLQEDLFSCVDINGYSHLKCEYAEKYSGVSNYFGKYQNYIKVGSNLPVNFKSALGDHEIYIDYGCDGAVNKICNYNVSICPDGICVPSDCDPSVEDCDNGDSGIDVIYRVIDLNNPFPNRTPGANWNITDFVDKYITNNRNVKTDEVYSKEPMYTIELDPAIIKEIRISNKDVNYGDLDLYCTDGVKCRSSYLRELRDNGYLSGCGTYDDFDACEVGG